MVHDLIGFIIVVAYVSFAAAWNYKEQDQWPPKYCGKAIAQSPIDLVESNMQNIRISPVIFNNWDTLYNATVLNNGHTVIVELSNQHPISISGGGLPGTFNLFQFHFHWGSEHTINGKRKALEAHFVSYHNKFRSPSEALGYSNGLLVHGVIYELSEKENMQLKPIVQHLGKVVNYQQSSQIEINPLQLLPDNKTKFYQYSGSLTTPDCNDVVVWRVFADMPLISQAQVGKFAATKNEKGESLSQNFRELQPLNGRTVYVLCAADSC